MTVWTNIVQAVFCSRTNFIKEIAALLRENYGSKIKVFNTEIPHLIRAKEMIAEGIPLCCK